MEHGIYDLWNIAVPKYPYTPPEMYGRKAPATLDAHATASPPSKHSIKAARVSASFDIRSSANEIARQTPTHGVTAAKPRNATLATPATFATLVATFLMTWKCVDEIKSSTTHSGPQHSPVGSVPFRGFPPTYPYALPVSATSGSRDRNCPVAGVVVAGPEVDETGLSAGVVTWQGRRGPRSRWLASACTRAKQERRRNRNAD
jgi:hypothetical protein